MNVLRFGVARGLPAAIVALLIAGAPASAVTGWSDPALVYDGNYYEPSMVVDAHGHAHIAAKGDTGIWYLTNENGGWTRTRLTHDHLRNGVPVNSFGPAIAIDPATGKVVVAYSRVVEYDVDPGPGANVRYRTLGRTGWSIPHSTHCPGALSSLAARRGTIAVATTDTSSTHPSMVWFCTNASGAWTRQHLGPQPDQDTRTVHLEKPSLALDSHGKPRIAYLRSTDFGDSSALYYAHGTTRQGDFLWHKVREAGAGVEAPSLVLDGHDRPRIALVADGWTRYAYQNASGWHLERVMRAKYLARLALDGSGRPRIVTQDASTYHLWYGARANGAWTTQLLEPRGGLTEIGGIAVVNGRTYVSYDLDAGAPSAGRVWFVHST